MAAWRSNDLAEVCFKKGPCTIILKYGDLLDERDVDVIVIPTPDNGQSISHAYPLFEAISSKADQKVKEQIKKSSREIRSGGKPQIISGPNSSIILTPIPYYGNDKIARQKLKETYIACLNLAAKEKCQTIAFPTIGCGQSSFPARDAAWNLYQTLSEHEQSRDKQFNEIRIVIFEENTYKEFTAVFGDSSCEKNAKIKLVDIPTKNPNSTEPRSKKDEKSASQQRSRDDDTQHYPDDFDDAADNQRRFTKQKSLGLDPDSPEFRPQRRDRRRYRIKDKKTELHIIQGDILQTKVDAIVNAANECMLGGSGVDGAIHNAAGPELLRACKAHKKIYSDVRLPIGRSRILLSYNMLKTTHYIINTTGPRYDDHSPDQCRKYLTSCYKTSLALADLYDLESIAFTAISCGIFGYPIDEGAEVALSTVLEHANLAKILFVLRDDDIYDAWVNKAEKLGFISLDDPDSVATSAYKHSTTNTQKRATQADSDDESDTARHTSGKRVIDKSTSDGAQKPLKPAGETSPDKATMNPTETSDELGTTEETQDDDKKNKKSPKKKNPTEEKDKTPASPSNSQQTPKQDQNNPNNRNKSIVGSSSGNKGKK